MLKPDFRQSSCVNKICYHFDTFLDKPFVKHLFRPLLVTSCTLIILIISRESFIDELTWLSIESRNFIKCYKVLSVVSVTFLLSLSSIARSYINILGKPNSCLNRDDVVSILDSLNQIVGNKSQRFLANTKLCFTQNWKPEDVFLKITVPEQQLQLLMKGIQGIFETLHNNEVIFRVGLLRIRENGNFEWQAFAPLESPPKTSLEELANPQSAVKTALQVRELVIIEDIERELKKADGQRHFIHGSGGNAKKGSILTFPIFCPNICQPIYVLSILADKQCLAEKNRGLYEWILNHFIQRIILEHHLMIMKEVSHEKG